MSLPRCHFYATEEPLVPNGALTCVCQTVVQRPVVVAVWDDVPMGTRLEAEKLPRGLCAKCRKQEQIESTYLYAVSEITEARKDDGSDQD